jgi:hypothetical protein
VQTTRSVVAVVVSFVLLNVTPAFGQQDHIVPPATMDRLFAEQSAMEAADREVVIETLRHPEVRRLAARLAVPLDRAESAVRTLDGDELTRLASQARRAQEALAGGQSSVRISTTLIIIALLVIILIVVAVD